MALRLHGPLRSPVLKISFCQETALSAKRVRSNAAAMLVSAPLADYHNSPDIIGINSEAMAIPEFIALLDKLADHYPVRELKQPQRVPHVPQSVEAVMWAKAKHPKVDYDAFFATAVRTRTLVALRALGNEYDIGKLQMSVLHHFVTRVRVAVQGLVEEGILELEGIHVRFNEQLPWLKEFFHLLDALSRRMPDVATYAKLQDETRQSRSGTSRAHGSKFRLIGSRVNQAIVTYLANYGPSRITEICASAAAVNPAAIDILIDQGVVCRIWAPGASSRKWKYSLNAAHPVYRELRALLRTEPVLQDSFPVLPNREIFEGEDHGEAVPKCVPYALFGVPRKAAVTSILTTLTYTEHQECDASALFSTLSGDHDYPTISKALKRLTKQGVLTTRPFKTLILYRLNPEYGGCAELRNLLVAIGREWPEFRENAKAAAETRSRLRVALDRGRTPP